MSPTRLAINGVVPSLGAMRSRQYPRGKTLGMVTVGEPRGLTRHFIEFVIGPDGERVMARHGFIAVR